MRKVMFILFSGWIATALAEPPMPMTMGDGIVRGERLKDYEYTWIQCSLQGGDWTSGPSLTEAWVVIGNLARQRQSLSQGNGILIQSTTYLDRASLAPLRMEQRVTGPDGQPLARVWRTLSESGYVGESLKSGEQKVLKGSITNQMWTGAALGLPLATIDANRYPVEFASSMMAFDGTYRTIATLAGQELHSISGTDVNTLMVDVEWHHHETGDVYPPGPDASGGRYWVVPDPPEGIPYVPQYQTDTYLVSTLIKNCPD